MLLHDVGVARELDAIRARPEEPGEPLADADLQIAATELRHGLVPVTGNLRHFERVARLELSPVFAEARRRN